MKETAKVFVAGQSFLNEVELFQRETVEKRAKMKFSEKLQQAWKQSQSIICVGLDPDPEKIPQHLMQKEEYVFSFNKEIIDATAEYCCAYKPQIAHYSAMGAETELSRTITYIHENYPKHLIILDAKRGDIGSTAEMYSKECFQRYKADAVTVNPYMGEDTVMPFSNNEEKGVFLLCRTSNPKAGELQELEVQGGMQLYEKVAELAATQWNKNKNLGLVVGATAPEQLKKVREIAPDLPFLVPGVGAQGGSMSEVLESGRDASGYGLLINSSRGIIYASSGEDFAEAAGFAAKSLRDQSLKS